MNGFDDDFKNIKQIDLSNNELKELNNAHIEYKEKKFI